MDTITTPTTTADARHYDTSDTDTLTGRKIAAATDAISFTLAAFGVPAKFRAYIDALIGTSGGELDWFQAADVEIGQRAREESRDISRAALTKWTQRQRDEFTDWQDETIITLVETMPGGQEGNGTRHKSRYRLPVLAIVLEVEERARQSAEWRRNRKRALRRAASAVYTERRRELIQPPRRERFRRAAPTSETYLKLAKTYLDKMTGRAMLEGADLTGLLLTLRAEIDANLEKLGVQNASDSKINSLEINELSPRPMDKYVHHMAVESDQVIAPSGESVHTHYKSMDKAEGAQGGAPPCAPETDALRAILGAGLYPDQVLFKSDDKRRVEVEHETTPADLERNITSYLDSAADQGRSFIVRVRGHFIQVDDCDRETLERLKPYSFMQIETSAGNYQSWLSVSDTGGDLETLRRRFFEALKLEGLTGNGGSYGALRWPGSVNFKPRRDEFTVRLLHTSARRVSLEELERAGLLADLPEPPPRSEATRAGNRPWPSYDIELGAHIKEDGGTDRSKADFGFALKALDRGHSIEATIAELERLSDKAAERRDGYARKTVERAARIVRVAV